MKNISNNTIWTGIGALVLGLIIGWLVGHGMAVSKAPVSTYNDSSEEASTSPVDKIMGSAGALSMGSTMSEESNSAIMLADQGAGTVATVGSVETDVSAWVVVREDTNGVVGNILGATRVDSGNSNNIVINLLRPTEVGKTYRVVLFKDDGDKKFDYKTDTPMTSNGVLISQSFKVFAQ